MSRYEFQAPSQLAFIGACRRAEDQRGQRGESDGKVQSQRADVILKPHSTGKLSKLPNPDPVGTLGMSHSRPAPGVPVETEFVLHSTILSRRRF
jgi:hypothetical protein